MVLLQGKSHIFQIIFVNLLRLINFSIVVWNLKFQWGKDGEKKNLDLPRLQRGMTVMTFRKSDHIYGILWAVIRRRV